MRRLSSTERERLYDAEAARTRRAGLGDLPICNICGVPVDGIRTAWDESHMPVPKALGGVKTGIAHRKCNRDHGAQVVAPSIAKGKRVRRRYIGARRSRWPLAGGRDHLLKRKVGGEIERRD